MLPNPRHDRLAADISIVRDEDLVFEARTLLGLLDFDFFRAAWRTWYGEEPDDRRLEPGFMNLLFKQQAPDCVRHFARLILRRAADGCLDPAAFGIATEPEVVPQTACLHDEFASTSLWVVMGLLLIVVF